VVTCLLAIPSVVFFLTLTNCAGERLIYLYRVHVISSSEVSLKLHYGKWWRAVRLVREKQEMGPAWGPVALAAKFKLMDTNGNGYIDKGELMRSFPVICNESVHPSTALSTADLDALIDEADQDRDGKLNYTEAAFAIGTLLDNVEDETQAALDMAIMLGGCLLMLTIFIASALMEYVMFASEDRWAFMDAIYFQLVTGLSIGLGDFVPAVPNPAEHPSILLLVDGVSASDRAVVHSRAVLLRFNVWMYFQVPLLVSLVGAMVSAAISYTKLTVDLRRRAMEKEGIDPDASDSDDDASCLTESTPQPSDSLAAPQTPRRLTAFEDAMGRIYGDSS
jgi:hypothetical protein